MGLIARKYREQLLCRYDKDGYTPYLSASDFPGLISDEGTFVNTAGVAVAFFRYRYEGFDPAKLVVFCHGLGAGHTAYLAEIEYLCRNGLQVLTLDYTGCDKSGGDGMLSVNRPTRDVVELLDYLKPKEEVIVVGHSLGGYTALNVIRMTDKIKRAVILSGFLVSRQMLGHFIKSRLINYFVERAERKVHYAVKAFAALTEGNMRMGVGHIKTYPAVFPIVLPVKNHQKHRSINQRKRSRCEHTGTVGLLLMTESFHNLSLSVF